MIVNQVALAIHFIANDIFFFTFYDLSTRPYRCGSATVNQVFVGYNFYWCLHHLNLIRYHFRAVDLRERQISELSYSIHILFLDVPFNIISLSL